MASLAVKDIVLAGSVEYNLAQTICSSLVQEQPQILRLLSASADFARDDTEEIRELLNHGNRRTA